MNKKTNKFDYPHPLINNLGATKHYTQQNHKQLTKQKLPFYENNYTFSPSIKGVISPKLLRLSNTKVVPGQKFGVLMQPFNQKQKVQAISIPEKEKENWKCSNCHSFFNYNTQSVSFYDVKCRICQNVQPISLQLKNALENVPSCWDFTPQSTAVLDKRIQKNICFVIEASQFNYNYRVHEVIQSCLNSLNLTKKVVQIDRKYSQVCTEDGSSSQVSICELQVDPELTQVNYNVGFILFNDKNLLVLNQQTCEVLNFSSQLSTNDIQNQKDSIIDFNSLFKPLDQISSQTYEMIRQVLYTSYLKNTSCLDFTIKFIKCCVDNFFTKMNDQNDLNQYCKKQVQYKFFINSLKFTKKDQPSESIITKCGNQNGSAASILFNIKNKISSKVNFGSVKNNPKLSRDQTQATSLFSSHLTLCPNFDFFYLPHSQTSSACQVSQKQLISKLSNNLCKMYQKTRNLSPTNPNTQLFNEMYYDLFENLTMSYKYFDVKVKIIASQKVEVLYVGNKVLGYNDCSQQLTKLKNNARSGKRFNQYSITMNSIQSTNTLPIDLKILCNQLTNNKSPVEDKHFIQIGLQYKKYHIRDDISTCQTFQRLFQVEVSSLNRPINFHHHIYASLSTYVDDETLFYFHLRSIFMECHKQRTNHTILKKLTSKMQEIADNFKDQYGQIDFHKEYVRIFLYCFMVSNKSLTNGIDQNFYYSRHLWMKNSMQCVAKAIYPRTYDITKNKQSSKIELKNVKSYPKSFKADSLLLLDNGKNLHFVIGEDNTVQDLKNIFGTCFIHQIRQMTELPQLSSNYYYRQIIDRARSYHQSNFLPLKIMGLFSPQFDEEIANLLYIKDDHYRYMRKLWEMQPINRKIRC